MRKITKSKSNLLVTTGLRKTWGKAQNIVFLGEWCKSSPEQFDINHRAHQTLKFHWSDRDKLKKDFIYIRSLNERILDNLVLILNDFHQTSKSQRYWKIILGPWLFLFVPILFDRWESIRIALENFQLDETFVSDFLKEECIPNDYDDLNSLLNDDYWNHLIYSYLLTNYFKKKIKTKFLDSELNAYHRETKFEGNLIKTKLLYYLDKVNSILNNNQSVVFVDSYFDKINLIKIMIKIKQFPRLNSIFNKKITYKREYSELRTKKLNIKAANDFEILIEDFLFSMIPFAYLESYQSLNYESESINQNPKIIFTAISHYNNELFKVWAANQVENQSKLIIIDHGGGIPYKYSLMVEHENQIADKKIVWHSPLNNNQVQLSPSKLIRSKIKMVDAQNILLVGFESPRYSYFIQSGPVSSLVLNDFKKTLSFLKQLSNDSCSNLRIRPASDQGWNLAKAYTEEFGYKKISRSETLNQAFKRSKLVICTYPSTTFSEAMASNIPTILIYFEEVWELHPQFNELLEKLKKSKIVFTNYEEAAIHVNNISKNPEVWWHSYEVIETRAYYKKICGDVSVNWLDEWCIFFKHQLIN